MAAYSWIALALLACGSDPPKPPEVPSPEAVRDFYGLGDGSCWRYRFSSGGASLFAGATAAGPDSARVAGKNVFVWSFRLESGGLPNEWLLDTESGGEVRLVRNSEGQGQDRVTYRYEGSDKLPLFAGFLLNLDKTPLLQVGKRFETDATPERCPQNQDCAPAEVERHIWSVLSDADTVSTTDGQAPVASLTLEYRRRNQTARYSLVPGFGFAKFTDFDGTFYQVCNARVCDSKGTCTGAASCSDLVCMP